MFTMFKNSFLGSHKPDNTPKETNIPHSYIIITHPCFLYRSAENPPTFTIRIHSSKTDNLYLCKAVTN